MFYNSFVQRCCIKWNGGLPVNKANEDIRLLIGKNLLKYWQVAEAIGISSFTFSVWLRTPLTDERKARVEEAINKLANQTY